MPRSDCSGVFHVRTAVTVTAATAENIDPFALLTATEAGRYARVSVQAIWNWNNRGHLPSAKDADGNEILDARGKRQYYLVDVAKADAKMAAQRERMALRLVSGI